ncbi:MAG: protein kinase domain-containing protein [Thermoguttaceae bacterium]
MTDISIEELTQRALHVGILTQAQLQEVRRMFGPGDPDSTRFLQELQRLGFLTNYQIDRLQSRETTGFFFGDYKVLYRIGAGSFARVFRATHQTTGKIVALKVLRSRFNDDSAIINHFVHEAEMGISLRHPNIVPIFEVKSTKDASYMVMDFVEGQTLRDFVKTRKKVDSKVATRIITDVCNGLDYASKRGVLHRDLKLSNVLLSSMGKAMLVDFGLAAIMENEAGFAGLKNQRSIDYAVLENTTNVRRDDSRSDIFFLGCMYYHLLTGEPPLTETKDRVKRSDKNRFYQIKPLLGLEPGIPWAVNAIVQKAMSLDVNRRFQTMGEILLELESCARRLADGTANQENPSATLESETVRNSSVSPESQHCLMIVESNPELQTVFRESLKKAGYKVLLASSAERAVDRLLDDNQVADLVIFNAQYLGRAALDGYNRLALDGYSRSIPLLLLVEERQLELLSDITRDEQHHILVLPLSLKQLKETIAKLLSKNPKESARTGEIPQFIELPSFVSEPEESDKSNELEVSNNKVNEEDGEEEDVDEEPSDCSDSKVTGYKDILSQEHVEENRQSDALFENAISSIHLNGPTSARTPSSREKRMSFSTETRTSSPVEKELKWGPISFPLSENVTNQELRAGLNAVQEQLNLIQKYLNELASRLEQDEVDQNERD